MLQLDRDAVAAALDRRALIERLAAAFAEGCEAPLRASYAIGAPGAPATTLLTMPAWRPGAVAGVKLATVAAGNATLGLPAVHALYLLFDADTGRPRALIDGEELTLRRTGAASALAARHLAAPDASRLLMVGTGALAPHLIRSHACVRPIRSVRIWGRRPERAAALAHRLAADAADGDVAFEACRDLAEAVAWADIVCCATLSRDPLLHGAWLRAGQHLDLVGAFRPDMREADDDCLRRARVYVDTRAGALAESGELVQAFASGALARCDVRGELAELVRGTVPGRGSASEITLFKSVGTALEDLAAAELAVANHRARSLPAAPPERPADED